MLESFRRGIKSWYFKVLFGLLILSFLTWGVGDMVGRGFGRGPAIEVGGTAISAAEVQTEFRREVERLQPLFGGKLTAEDARKMGLMERTIDNIVARTLIDEAGRRLGLATSDEAVIAQVTADPMFRDEQGNFDRNRLRFALQRAGLTEAEFLRIERANLIRNQMAGALSGGVEAPRVLLDPLVRWREERRVAELVLVRADAIPAPAAPAADELEKYYKERSDLFMAPEYRAVTALLLRPEDAAGEVEVTEQMVKDAYAARSDEFHTPERREVSQIVLADDAEAAKAAGMVAAGRALPAIAKELGHEVVDLGAVEQGDLPDELSQAVFSLPKGATSKPVRTDLGHHVIQVTGVASAQTLPLAEVRDQIAAELKRDLALDRLHDLSVAVEDTLGAGATLEEAAQRHNLKLVRVEAVDAQGRRPDGKPATGLPRPDLMMDVAFTTPQGDESQLTEMDADGFFILRVDSVTPPQPKPLAEVSEQVLASWRGEQRQTLAGQRAEAIADKVRKGESLASAAKAHNLTVSTSRPFTRDAAQAEQVPPGLAADLFDAKPGEVAAAPVSGGWLVARLAAIQPFDPAADPDAVEAASARVGQSVAADLIDQYLAALRRDLGVTVDRAQLAREE